MTLIKYNPVLRNLEENSFAKALDGFFGSPAANHANGYSGYKPQIDIAETKSDFQIELAVPGMKKEDFTIDMKKDELFISGERKRAEKQEEKNYHSVGTFFGKFSRSFFLPEDIKKDEIQATYADGILKISIPKDEKKALVRTIQVK